MNSTTLSEQATTYLNINKYNTENAYKLNAKLDSIKYNIKRKKWDYEQGIITTEQYTRYLHYQNELYSQIQTQLKELVYYSNTNF